MLQRPEFAEIDARRKGDAGTVKDVAGERFAVFCECADVGVDEESAVGENGDFETDVDERIGEVVSARFEFGAARFGDGVARIGEAGERSMLRQCCGRNVEILRELFEVADMAFRCD